MIYDYKCDACGHRFDVWKTVSEIDRLEPCEQCEGNTQRVIHPPRGFINAKVEEAEYNPGLGCVVKNRAHRTELAKQRGLIEVGNDATPETMEKDAQANLQKKLSYEDIV